MAGIRIPSSPRTEDARSLFAGLGPTYDLMGTILSLGQDPRWRRFLVSRISAGPGDRILDVATGTGAVAIEAVRRTAGRAVGLDQSEPMLQQATRRVSGAGLGDGIHLVLGQAERLPFPDRSFDALTFTYLLRYVDDPAATLAELARVVRAGGTVASLEFHVPDNRAWRALWWLYTRALMPLVGAAVSGPWYRAGRFLGPSISSFYRRHPLVEQLEMWRAAGVGDVRTRVMGLGGGVVTWGTIQ